jgi:hypothetical protein
MSVAGKFDGGGSEVDVEPSGFATRAVVKSTTVA